MDVEGILQDLMKLNLADRQVLGRRDHNALPPAAPAPLPHKPAKKKSTGDERTVIRLDLSDTTNVNSQKAGVMRLTKATQLAGLTRRVRDTTDNLALARVVREFRDVLESSRSRTLTKEGFAFLDALHKQLADPSVFVQPMRTSRRLQQLSTQEAGGVVTREAKITKLATLRRDVVRAKSNRQLAKLVSEYGTTIDQSKGRTITKDSILFLQELADSVRALS